MSISLCSRVRASALHRLTPTQRSPEAMLSRLRVVASLVTRRAPAIDEVDALLNDETTQRRREALGHELSLISRVIDPSVGPPPLEQDLVLTTVENDIQRMAKCLSDAIHARLLRMEQRTEDSRMLEERLERVMGPLDPELAAAEKAGQEEALQVEAVTPGKEEEEETPEQQQHQNAGSGKHEADHQLRRGNPDKIDEKSH